MLRKLKKLMILFVLLSLVVGLKGCDNEENNDYDVYIEEAEEEEEVEIEIVHVEPGERIPWRTEAADTENEEDEEDSPGELDIQPTDPWFFSIQHEARYIFEQFTIAELSSEHEEAAIRFLQDADEEGMWDSVTNIWEMTVSFVLMIAIIQDPEITIGPDGSPDPFSPELHSELGLGPEHLIEGWMEEIDENTNAYIFRLLDMEIPRLSIYMAIAYNDEAGLQFFTLEEMEGVTEDYMFCFVAVGSRGSFYSIDGTREAFIEAIYDAMVNLTQPAISQNRSRWL